MHNHRIFILGLLIILLPVLSACTRAGRPASPEAAQTTVPDVPTLPPTAEPTTAPTATETSVPIPELRRIVGDGSATIAFNQEFDMLNPLYAQALSAQIVYDIWNCRAWNFDVQGNALPILVKQIPSFKSGEISTDGKIITLHLRDDIVWSDGEPITSKDFVFTYEMITNPQNIIQDVTPYDQVEEVSAPDPQTVVVHFKEPYAAWLHSLWKVLLPAHILEPEFEAQGTIQEADWNFSPSVSCGPFVFEGREIGESVTFKVNEKYWLDYPLLGKILIRFYPDDASKAQAIIKAEADLSIFLIDTGTQIPLMRDAKMQILTVDSGYREGFFFFLDPTRGHPALQDVRVRQAIAMAIDREAILQKVYQGDRHITKSYWDNTPYIDPNLQPWVYDPDRAKSLLDEAGWVDSNGNGSRDKDGRELILSYGTTTSNARQMVQAEIQKYLSSVGVLTNLINYDSSIFFGDLAQGGPAATGNLDLFQYSVRTFNNPDPGTSDFLCDEIPTTELPQGVNWAYLCDPELDELFKRQSLQIDSQERQSTFHSISKMIFDKVYFVGLWDDPDYWAANPRLKNVQISGSTPFYNISEWDVEP